MKKCEELFIKIKNIIYVMFFSKINNENKLSSFQLYTIRILYFLNLIAVVFGILIFDYWVLGINLIAVILLYFTFFYEKKKLI